MSVFGRAYGQRISGEVLCMGKRSMSRALARPWTAVSLTSPKIARRLDSTLLIISSITSPLANLDGVSKTGVINDLQELNVANDYRQKMNIRCSSVYQTAGNLSGGNQQKVVLSKWLFVNPEVLILDEPTRGIDVGAKYEIYTIINQLADSE